MRIIQLPPAIANQIAAGEVIERPASVVKELLENAFDAGANSISIEAVYGGLNQIKISDNGEGIIADDLPLAVLAHATSKIKTLDDLYAINSMGFRGEALASIASVANVCITSKPALQEHAMMLRVVGPSRELTPCARNKGTTIEVSDLFYNAPVRKRFLKSETLELQAIETVVKRFALSAPHIAIRLTHNGQVIFSLPASEYKDLKRVTKILGSAFIKNAIFLEVEHANMQLYGWISNQHYQRSHNDKMWVYINQRMVKDKLIHHALKQVYEGLLHPGRFPAGLLYFNLPNNEVDVNVHPTKHEVRFVSPKLIHDFFTSQLSKALSVSNQKVHSYNSVSLQPQASVQASFDQPLFDSWTHLNERYVLISVAQRVYLIDIMRFLQAKFRHAVMKTGLPLPARRLTVPIGFPATKHLKEKIETLSPDLIQLALQIECDNDDQVWFRSIPSSIPYLDLRLFLNTIEHTDVFNREGLLDIMSQSQQLDSRLISFEEKEEMVHGLENPDLMQPVWRRLLTEEVCRDLLYD